MAVFIPNEPQNGETVDADLLRNNFSALHDEATAPETDPVFAASEAALLGPGDKTKLDAGFVSGSGPLTVRALHTGNPDTEVALLIKDDTGGDWLVFIGNASGTGNRIVGD